MANKTPFTEGKNSRQDQGGKPGGKFQEGTGGHTSRGVYLPPASAPGSTSDENTRVGTLKKRMHGANGTDGMPK
jgi:hypothetical protein